MSEGTIVAVGHVVIRTRDLQRCLAFYRDLLGLKQVIKGDYFNAFEVGLVHFCVMPGKPGEATFDLTSDDVGALRARLLAADVPCTELRDDKVSGHRSFVLTDPDGHDIAINSAHEADMPAV